MKRLLVLALVLCCSASANAALTLEEIRTASNNVLVAYFKSTAIKADEVNTACPPPGSSTASRCRPSISSSPRPTPAIITFTSRCRRWSTARAYTLQTPHGDKPASCSTTTRFSASRSRPIRTPTVPSRRSAMPISPSGWATAAPSRSAAACRRTPSSSSPTAGRLAQGSCSRRSARTHPRAITSTASICRRFPRAAPTGSP